MINRNAFIVSVNAAHFLPAAEFFLCIMNTSLKTPKATIAYVTIVSYKSVTITPFLLGKSQIFTKHDEI